MRKICFLITGLNYGGAEASLVQIARRLKDRGWQVRVVTILPPAGYASVLEASGIPVASLGMRRRVPDPRAIFRTATLLRRWHPDILHTHMVHANLLGRIVRLLYNVPVLISTAHSIMEGGRWRDVAYRVTDPLCDITTQVSKAGLERYVRLRLVPEHKIRLVPNGVDAKTFAPNLRIREELRSQLELGENFVWLAVGRFEEPKDYPNMLRAFAQAVAHMKGYNEVTLLIAGEGPTKPAVEALARELGVECRVRFLGMRRDVAGLMNAADAFLLSSAWEGLPMVLLEAAAVGLPIVATEVGGNAEVVREGISGFLVPPGDHQALAGAMIRMMRLPEGERRKMGEAGRSHVRERYEIERVVDQWEALYVELLGASGRSNTDLD